MKKGKSVEEIADVLEEDVETIKALIDEINNDNANDESVHEETIL